MELYINDLIFSEKTMSSLEISELTGKLHKNVMKKIEAVLFNVEISRLKFERSYIDSRGKTRKMYVLPRLECDLVISGMSDKYRHAIIKRWHELEKKEMDIVCMKIEEMELEIHELKKQNKQMATPLKTNNMEDYLNNYFLNKKHINL